MFFFLICHLKWVIFLQLFVYKKKKLFTDARKYRVFYSLYYEKTSRKLGIILILLQIDNWFDIANIFETSNIYI